MTESVVRPSGGVRAGSADKREAIRRAALALFARDGFARTSVDAVAAEAGVSKRTVYDYYGDKDRLFLDVLAQSTTSEDERFAELVARTLGGEVSDLHAALTAFGRELAVGVTTSAERQAVVRLMVTEAPHFPELLDRWRAPGAAQRILAGALAALAERGLLEVPDAMEAAEQLGVLVTARVQTRTLYGSVPIDRTDLDQLVESGVALFLRAYEAARPSEPTFRRSHRPSGVRDTP